MSQIEIQRSGLIDQCGAYWSDGPESYQYDGIPAGDWACCRGNRRHRRGDRDATDRHTALTEQERLRPKGPKGETTARLLAISRAWYAVGTQKISESLEPLRTDATEPL